MRAFPIVLIVPILFMISGCNNKPLPKQPSASKLTIQKAAEANTAASLLGRYKTVTYAQLDYIGGKTIHTTFFKDTNGNLCAAEDDVGYTGYRTDYFDFSREKGQSTYTLSLTKDKNVSDYLFMVADSQFTSQKTDANGNIVCETQANIDQAFADQLSACWPVTTKDKMITTTVFASNDFRVLTSDFSVRRPDGTSLKIASGVLVYDKEVQFTDVVQSYLGSKKFTVTVQMPDNSKRTATIPKGEAFSWTCDDGFALYLNANDKTSLAGKSIRPDQDMTLYVQKS